VTQEERESRTRESLPVEVVLVRHGEPDWDRAFETRSDPGLTLLGERQADLVAAHLKRQPVVAVYCSPLVRAKETAAAIAAAQELDPQIIHGLEEIRVPVLESVSQSEVDAYFAAAARRPLIDRWKGYPGGESFRDFHARVTSAIQSILA